MSDSFKENTGKNERLLSFILSQEFTEEDLKKISGAGFGGTKEVCYRPSSGPDVYVDFEFTW